MLTEVRRSTPDDTNVAARRRDACLTLGDLMQIRIWPTLASCLAAAALLVSVHARANPELVDNGDFETCDFSGWTEFGETAFSGVDGNAPLAGSCAAFFGPVTSGGIQQSITTVVGHSYEVEFWLQNEADPFGASIPNSFSFSWNGAPVSLATDSPAFGYTHYSFVLSATDVATLIRFDFRHLPAFWDLDNVSVTERLVTVPEPGSLALLALGIGAAAMVRRRRRT